MFLFVLQAITGNPHLAKYVLTERKVILYFKQVRMRSSTFSYSWIQLARWAYDYWCTVSSVWSVAQLARTNTQEIKQSPWLSSLCTTFWYVFLTCYISFVIHGWYLFWRVPCLNNELFKLFMSAFFSNSIIGVSSCSVQYNLKLDDIGWGLNFCPQIVTGIFNCGPCAGIF